MWLCIDGDEKNWPDAWQLVDNAQEVEKMEEDMKNMGIK